MRALVIALVAVLGGAATVGALTGLVGSDARKVPDGVVLARVDIVHDRERAGRKVGATRLVGQFCVAEVAADAAGATVDPFAALAACDAAPVMAQTVPSPKPTRASAPTHDAAPQRVSVADLTAAVGAVSLGPTPSPMPVSSPPAWPSPGPTADRGGAADAPLSKYAAANERAKIAERPIVADAVRRVAARAVRVSLVVPEPVPVGRAVRRSGTIAAVHGVGQAAPLAAVANGERPVRSATADGLPQVAGWAAAMGAETTVLADTRHNPPAVDTIVVRPSGATAAVQSVALSEKALKAAPQLARATRDDTSSRPGPAGPERAERDALAPELTRSARATEMPSPALVFGPPPRGPGVRVAARTPNVVTDAARVLPAPAVGAPATTDGSTTPGRFGPPLPVQAAPYRAAFRRANPGRAVTHRNAAPRQRSSNRRRTRRTTERTTRSTPSTRPAKQAPKPTGRHVPWYNRAFGGQ